MSLFQRLAGRRIGRSKDVIRPILVVGLGNPGPQYFDTRHNVGFRVLDELAGCMGVEFGDVGHFSLASNGSLYGRHVLLAKPQDFMNRSGGVIHGLLEEFGLGVSDLLVVHDEIDFSFGKIRLKRRGGDGGHRGVRSVIERMGSDGFARIRVGIGRGGKGESESDYVLSPFTRQQEEDLRVVIGLVADRIDELIRIWDRDKLPEETRGEMHT